MKKFCKKCKTFNKTYLLIALIVLFSSLIAGHANALIWCDRCSTVYPCQYAVWQVHDNDYCESSDKLNVRYIPNDGCDLCPSGQICSGGACVPCTCSDWTNQGCGVAAGCYDSSQMYQTRTCSPAGCQIQAQCVPNYPSCACTDTTWSPDPSTVCDGQSFTQTSNCGNTRTSTGTKICVVTGHCSRCSAVYDRQWVEFDSTDATCVTLVPSSNPVTRSLNCTCSAGDASWYNSNYSGVCASMCTVTKYYKCSGTSCIQDTTGGTGFPNDSTCANTCAVDCYYCESSNGQCYPVTAYSRAECIDRGSVPQAQCQASCSAAPQPDFSLNSSNTIYATLVQGQAGDSSATTLTISPFNGFSSNISLSVQSVSPSLPSGSTFNFSRTSLNQSKYSSGSEFSVHIGSGLSASQTYTITIKGVDGGLIRTTNVILNAQVQNPNWREI